MTSSPDRRSRFGVALLVLLTCYVLPFLAFVWQLHVAPTENASGQCNGIRFGCTLAPRDALQFAGVVLGLPALAVGLVLSSITAALLARDDERGAVDLGLVAAWPAFLGFVVVLFAGAAMT